ncbi:MAG TPA: hypothetical protein PKD46_10680 [Aggregatilineaceae bacterium]|nr:hypothetical protein [Anaerolineae bacterium]HMM28739.1 hypothetical protein [Aggregatilineaceae bacterium]
MYHLATLAPPVARFRLPFSRDQLMLLLAAVNEIFLGIDIFLAHSISGTIVPYEWIPIIYGPVAGVVLLVAGLIALRSRPTATLLASVVLAGSIVVGLLGAYFHLIRAALPSGPAGEQLTVRLLVWGPPVLGPLMFAFVGLWGLSAAWVEDPPDSGRLRLPGGRTLKLPLSKTRAYFLMFSLASLSTVLSSVLDHARTQFENPWLWIPTTVGVFATVIGFYMATLERPHRFDIGIYVAAMGLLMLTGLIGTVLHVDDSLTSRGQFVAERFIRGAPIMAPMLFANVGLFGLLILLDPRSEVLVREDRTG